MIAVVGVATAFFAATIAVVQTDIKKVLAYSTISQLGFMFVAIGVGAYGVAIFHLYTHAFFKACLFLGAGSVIHALGGEQDIRKMGGLARSIPVTFVTFAIATAAIAGIPPLAGFFSKDEILWFALASERGGSPAAVRRRLAHGAADRVLHVQAAVAHVLRRAADGRGDRASRPRVAGVDDRRARRARHRLRGRRLRRDPALSRAAAAAAGRAGGTGAVRASRWSALSVALAFAGLAGAAYFFGGDGTRAEALRARFAGLHRVLSGKYFVDEAYDALLARPLQWVSERVFLGLGDRVLLDGSLHGLAGLARRTAGVLARVQTGNLQLYLFLALAGLVGGARLELAPWLTPACSNLVLFLPVIGAALLVCVPERDDGARPLRCRSRDDRAVRAHGLPVRAVRRRRSRPAVRDAHAVDRRLGRVLPHRPRRHERAAGAADRVPRAAGRRGRVHGDPQGREALLRDGVRRSSSR